MTQEEFLNELDDIRHRLAKGAAGAAERYFANGPSRATMLEWLRTRCWREMDYVLLISHVLLKYQPDLDPRIITSLCKQSWDEARHYEMLLGPIRQLGGEPPVTHTPADAGWHRVLWEAVDRDRVGAVAGWFVSETAAAATLPIIIEQAPKCGYPGLAPIYERIAKDEEFHINLGQLILGRYAAPDPHAQAEALRAAREISDALVYSYGQIYAPVGAGP